MIHGLRGAGASLGLALAVPALVPSTCTVDTAPGEHAGSTGGQLSVATAGSDVGHMAGTAGSGGSVTLPLSEATGGAEPDTALTAGFGGTGADVEPSAGLGGVSMDTGGASPLPPAAGSAGTCHEMEFETSPIPNDLVILMERSALLGLPPGADSDASASEGTVRRWDIVMSAIESLATWPDAALIEASLTVFSLTGGAAESPNCDPDLYANPMVPLGPLGDTAPVMVDAMQSLTPMGLAPIVPALIGVYRYAKGEQRMTRARNRAVVLITPGFPTQCAVKAPSDVVPVIQQAASTSDPIRTYVVGIGPPDMMDSARFNLLNYARAGGTGRQPYILDEDRGAEAVRDQLVLALMQISLNSGGCDYPLPELNAHESLDPGRVRFLVDSPYGERREVPRVSSASACADTPNGGWYFDDPVSPARIITCLSTCEEAMLASKSVVYSCERGAGSGE